MLCARGTIQTSAGGQRYPKPLGRWNIFVLHQEMMAALTSSAVMIFFTAGFCPVSLADATQPFRGKSSLAILAFSSLWVSFLSTRNLAEFPIISVFEWEGKRLGFLLFCNNGE